MNNTMPLKINTGVEKNAVPSIEGCLQENAGKFYSAQNAIRVHEWLRGTEVVPLVLEAVKSNAAGLLDTVSLGKTHIPLYLTGMFPGKLLGLEQDLAAIPEIKRVMVSNIKFFDENRSERLQTKLSDSTQSMQEMLSRIWAFSACSMLYDTAIPTRFIFETMETLDILFTAVITQRRKTYYQSDDTWESEIPEGMYSKAELDRILGVIHQAAYTGDFPNPDTITKNLNLIDSSFYRQCAMAVSRTCGIEIPLTYLEEKPSRVYFWACKILTMNVSKVSEYDMRPKQQNVVNLFSKM